MKQFFYKYSTHNDYLAYDKFANYNANGNTLDLVSYCEEENELHYDSSTGKNNSIVPIEYLYANSASYSDTFQFNSGVKYVKGGGFGIYYNGFACQKSTSGYVPFIGTVHSTARALVYVNPGGPQTNLDWGNSAGGMFNSNVNIKTGIHTIEIKSTSSTQTGTYYDGTFHKNFNNFNPASSNVYFLYTGYKYTIKLMGCWVYNASNEKIFDAIPVRLGTVGYLYDKISGKLLKNQGTGTFTLGPDL